MTLGGMKSQDGVAHHLYLLNVPNPLGSRIAVNDPILVINKDNPLFHGSEDSFQNR